MHRRQVLALLPPLVAGLPVTARAQVASVPSGTVAPVSHADVRKLVAVFTLTEAALMLAAQVNTKPSQSGEAKWWASYNEHTWQLGLDGGVDKTSVSARLVGTVWGNERQNLLVTYAGNGQIGKEPILVHGKVDWPYDRERRDYLTTDFWHLTKFGTDSTWDWIVAAETIFGGVGSAAAITNPVGLLGFLALGVAALSGSAVLRSESNSRRPARSDTPAIPPPSPPRPAQAASQPSSQRQDDQVVIECTKEGAFTLRVTGSGLGAANIEGSCQDGRGSGRINWRGR